MTPSRAGPGTSTDGPTSSAASTSPVEHPFTSRLGPPRSPSPSTSASGAGTAPTASLTSRTTPPMSSSAPSSCGSVGSGSTAAPLSPLTCARLRRASLLTWRLASAASPGCSGTTGSRGSGPQWASAPALSPVWLRSRRALVSSGHVRFSPRIVYFLRDAHTIWTAIIAAAVLFGFMAGTLCNFATQLKFVFRYDDCLDVSMPPPLDIVVRIADTCPRAADLCVACDRRCHR